MNPVIVYLAQNTRTDEQHGRTSRDMLERSLDYLYAFYNRRFKQDIVIFHEGDFTQLDQREIIKGRAEIRFEQVTFEIPDRPYKHFVADYWYENGAKHYCWNLGHRHMCRFYGITLWETVAKLGYDWVMRFDDDSFLLSEVKYDLFKHLADNGYRYGYRVDCWEPESLCVGFQALVEQHLCERRLRAPIYRGLRNRKPGDFVGYYNNWFATDVNFWLAADVQDFLQRVDETGNIYLRRWNDLVIQAAAVQLFLKPAQVYKFTDWTYQHASTNRDGSLGWGGVFVGSSDPRCSYADGFRRSYGRLLANGMTY
jgi:alpha 1,2-mannosyltransferase